MSEEKQRIITTVAHSGKSLLLTLTDQLRSLGVSPGNKVSVTWDAKEIVIRRADKP
jgi:hypothetical protein